MVAASRSNDASTRGWSVSLQTVAVASRRSEFEEKEQPQRRDGRKEIAKEEFKTNHNGAERHGQE